MSSFRTFSLSHYIHKKFVVYKKLFSYNGPQNNREDPMSIPSVKPDTVTNNSPEVEKNKELLPIEAVAQTALSGSNIPPKKRKQLTDVSKKDEKNSSDLNIKFTKKPKAESEKLEVTISRDSKKRKVELSDDSTNHEKKPEKRRRDDSHREDISDEQTTKRRRSDETDDRRHRRPYSSSSSSSSRNQDYPSSQSSSSRHRSYSLTHDYQRGSQSMRKVHFFPMKGTVFLNAIKAGTKQYEGRVNGPGCKRMQVGEQLKLFDKRAGWGILCDIVSKTEYYNFKDMLEDKGVLSLLPQLTEKSKYLSHQQLVDEGLKIYHGFPGAQRVHQLGAVAIGVKYIQDVTQ